MNRCRTAVLKSEGRARAFALTRIAAFAAMLLPLAGCAVVSGSSTAAQIRIIDASPDAPGLDIYAGSNVLAYNLGLGTITSYIPINPGNYGILVDQDATRTQLVSAAATLQTGNQYTALIGNYLNSLQEVILKDQTTAAPSGQIDVRFIDQSVRGGAFDIYLVPSGSTIVQVKPVLTDITFNTNTGYMSVPAGTYTLVAIPTGTTPTATSTTLYTGSSVGYSSGAARTIVFLDQQLITTPGIQAIIAADYDSPAS
jgi:Domain of unknown function (DUF4397)